MELATAKATTYSLGHAPSEIQRLAAQSQLFEPATRQLFQEAGLSAGMRVLDVGCGPGDVSLLAASFAGPGGEIVGIDRAPQAVEAATQRVQSPEGNVRFLVADAATVQLGESFDAIVGRLVLGHMPDPLQAIRNLSTMLRPGGLMIFQEFDLSAARSCPPSPAFDQCITWMRKAFEAVGADMQLGLKLYSLYRAAGLPSPGMRVDAFVGSGRGHLSYSVAAGVIRSLLPVLTRFGIASAEEIDIETLSDRIEAEVDGSDGVIVSPSLIGAWTKVA